MAMTDDQTYLVPTGNHAHLEHYHATRECPRLKQPDKAVDRSPAYVNYHNLDPCSFCHDSECF